MKRETIIQLLLIPMGIMLFWIGLYIVDLFESIYVRTMFLIIPTIGVCMFFVTSLSLIDSYFAPKEKQE